MKKLLLSIALSINPAHTMEEHHHHSKHAEIVTIKIDPTHHVHKKESDLKYERQIKIALIGGGAIIASAGMAAAVALAIHFSNCK